MTKSGGGGDVDFPSTYFTTYAREAGAITFTIAKSVSTSQVQYISYSTDGGTTWVTTNNVGSQIVTITTPEVSQGTFIYWKGKGGSANSLGSGSEGCRVNGSAKFDVGGDLASLLREDDYETNHTIGSQGYKYLFKDSVNLVHAKHLNIIFDGNFPGYALNETFMGCTSLEDTPKIQWGQFVSGSTSALVGLFRNCTSLKEVTYPLQTLDFTNGGSAGNMFNGCTSLTKVQDINVTGLGSSCMQGMFQNCISIVHCPIKSIPNAVANNCFNSLFYGCASLVDCFEMPVATLVNGCYNQMFRNSNIPYVKMLATDISATSCLNNWMYGVPNVSTSIFVKHIDATWTTTGNSGVPNKWTIIYYDPALDKYYTDQTRATECDDHGNPI